MTPEKRVQNSIIKYLTRLQEENYPVYFIRRQAGGFSYKKGIPDLYAIINGHHLEIEVKAPNGEISSMQEKFRDKCKKYNISWVCASTIEEVSEKVQELLKM